MWSTPGDIGRRQHDAKRLAIGIVLGRKHARFLPNVIPVGFNRRRIVGGFHPRKLRYRRRGPLSSLEWLPATTASYRPNPFARYPLPVARTRCPKRWAMGGGRRARNAKTLPDVLGSVFAVRPLRGVASRSNLLPTRYDHGEWLSAARCVIGRGLGGTSQSKPVNGQRIPAMPFGVAVRRDRTQPEWAMPGFLRPVTGDR